MARGTIDYTAVATGDSDVVIFGIVGIVVEGEVDVAESKCFGLIDASRDIGDTRHTRGIGLGGDMFAIGKERKGNSIIGLSDIVEEIVAALRMVWIENIAIDRESNIGRRYGVLIGRVEEKAGITNIDEQLLSRNRHRINDHFFGDSRLIDIQHLLTGIEKQRERKKQQYRTERRHN